MAVIHTRLLSKTDRKNKIHRAPWECIFAKESKGRCKPGTKPKSEQEYFEILCLCVLQAGFSWDMVRENWPKFKKGFRNFKINKLAKARVDELMHNPNIIKNKRKIKAIIFNAKEFQNIKKKFGSSDRFLNSLKSIKNKEVFKILTKRFKYIGAYNAEYYLHSVGYWKEN